MSDDAPNDGFDYGERREDGQFENHPTTEEGEFVQPVRESYVHEECGGTTTMGQKLAESFARDPGQYGKTFCATCGDYFDVGAFRWKDTDRRLDEVGEDADGSGTEWLEYRRIPEVREARPVTEETVVETSHGPVEAGAGDFIVRGDDGEKWPVSGERFFSLYEPVDDRNEDLESDA